MYIIGSGELCKTAAIMPVRFQHAFNRIEGDLGKAMANGDRSKVLKLYKTRGNFLSRYGKHIEEADNAANMVEKATGKWPGYDKMENLWADALKNDELKKKSLATTKRMMAENAAAAKEVGAPYQFFRKR